MHLSIKQFNLLPFSLFILLLFLPIGNNIIGQDCDDSCDGQIKIPNNDFSQFDFDCFGSDFGPGNNGFNCVDDWNPDGSPDLFSPDFNTTHQFSPALSGLLTSEVAGLCYGVFSDHSEAINTNSIVLPSAPNVSYSLSLDLAAISVDYPDLLSLFDDIAPGELWVQIGDSNFESIPIDNSYNIMTGWKTVCIEGLVAPELESEVRFASYTINASNNRVFWILIDNISMNCEIENANLNITGWKLGPLQHDFDLIEDDPNLYASSINSIEWDFGDGNTSNELNTQHTYALPDTYTVTALVKDEFGCCTILSKEIEVTEGCGTVTLTGNNQVSDLVSALGTSDLTNAVATVEIDGILEIDQDVTFGKNLNFILTPSSTIVVNSNNLMTKNGGFIGPCSSNFGGVIVNSGGTLAIDDIRIWGADTAIKLEENSILTSVNSVIEDSGFGVYVNGEGQIPTFTGNRIENCNVGIYADNAFELNIDSPSTNYFNNCIHGISYRETGGSIRHCHFNNCQFGIVLGQSPIESTINDNVIYASEVGILLSEHFRIVWIGNNNIGQGGKTPRIGISVDNSRVVVNDNVAIHATWRAVSAHNPTHFTVWNNENIQVDDNPWDVNYSSGIYLNNPAGGARNIINNTISGKMNSNITCISCTETIINGNSLSGATGHGIALEGGSGSRVAVNQILNQPWKGIGLYSHNGGLIQENSIRARWNGLLVHNLSQTQDIGCNDFLQGTRDIETRSVLSPQFHRKNVFRTEGSRALTVGLDQFGVNSSRFTVEECPTDELIGKCYHPEQWEAPGLFEIFPEDPDLPFTCLYISGGVPPTNSGPRDEYWCWLFSQFESRQSSDPIKSWVQRYKALKLISFKHEGGIPEDCIPYNEFYCDMDEFIAIEHAVKDLMEDVSSSEYSYEVLESGVANRIADLDVLDCNNDIFKLYRDIYRSVLKDMVSREFSPSEREQVREAAELCAYTYGDVVYWARGILDHRGETRVYDDEYCEDDKNVAPRNKINAANDQIIVSPNPANNYIKIENKTNFDVLDINLTDSFGKVYEVPSKFNEQLKIDCTSFSSGVYFITITHSSGYRAVKRVVVTNK